ncbi:hypothetical protein KIH27_17790 [Mycobacterium sp. M1]|uniref:Uncharacterized protein n=1 Tax=Mycolicibacter acidiphilus TaxID=2835306 RepID=A0ABS5RMB1_9MYCO|nr:hypothetical protein [Mycolicibacter acidiphilus]MBS9535440.1 hypothetical protein [Mycolicibacter acidiphilus]
MSVERIPAEQLRPGQQFKTPDGLIASVDRVCVEGPANEVVVEYRSPSVTGSEVYPPGTLIPLV